MAGMLKAAGWPFLPEETQSLITLLDIAEPVSMRAGDDAARAADDAREFDETTWKEVAARPARPERFGSKMYRWHPAAVL